MASDNRDWYRDWWRKKTGYVERASFRISETERIRKNRGLHWSLVLLFWFAVLFALFVVFKAFR